MFRKEKTFLEFVEIVSKLEPIEFFGLCRILKVDIVDAEGGDREFDVMLEDLMDRFLAMKKKPRRQLMEMLRASQKEEKNGSGSEN